MAITGAWVFEEDDMSCGAVTDCDFPVLELRGSSREESDVDLFPSQTPIKLNEQPMNRASSLANTVSSSLHSDVPNIMNSFDLELEVNSTVGEQQRAVDLQESSMKVDLVRASKPAACKGLVKSGILFKKEMKWLRSKWKARFVELHFREMKVFAQENGKLRCQLNLAEMKMDHIQVMPADSIFDGQHGTMWRFAIRLKRTRMLFAAYTENELNDWVRSLQIALAVG